MCDRAGQVVVGTQARVSHASSRPDNREVHVLEFVHELRPPRGLPHHEQRIDPPCHVLVAQLSTSLDGLRRREVAGVEDHRETAPLPVGGALLEEEQQRLDRALVHLEETVGGESAIVAEHDQVRPDVAVGGDLVRRRLRRGLGAGAIVDAGRRDVDDPRVEPACEPIVVREQAIPFDTPFGPPRVVDPEAAVVVADDHDGVAAAFGVAGSALDHRLDLGHEQAVPADVQRCGCEQRMARCQRVLDARDVDPGDAAIAEQWPVTSVEQPREREVPVHGAELVVGVVRPQLVEGDAGATPPLERAAQRGPLLELLAVVELCDLVQHATADRWECRIVECAAP